MATRTVAITGPTSGIGRSAAIALARRGDALVLLVRDVARGRALADELVREGADAATTVIACDVASLASVREATAAVRAQVPRVDVLINNAGAIFQTRKLSVDGHELTWATNHLGPTLLTELLVPRLIESAPARIVTVASRAHTRGSIHWDDVELARDFTPWRAYCQSKLANVMMASAIARRLAGSGVVSHSLHPGVVASGFGTNDGGLLALAMRLGRPFLRTNEQGAATTVFLATSPEAQATTGVYWANERPARATREARDVDAQERLMALTRKTVGL